MKLALSVIQCFLTDRYYPKYIHGMHRLYTHENDMNTFMLVVLNLGDHTVSPGQEVYLRNRRRSPDKRKQQKQHKD